MNDYETTHTLTVTLAQELTYLTQFTNEANREHMDGLVCDGGDTDPTESVIAALRRARITAEYGLTAAVKVARVQGYSWAQIAHDLKVSPQAAQQRYGKACE